MELATAAAAGVAAGKRRAIKGISAVLPLEPLIGQWIAWLQFFISTLIHKYYKPITWERARPAFLLVLFLIIQQYFRRYLSWKSKLRLQGPAIALQTAARGLAARQELERRKLRRAATVIQAQWRCHTEHTQYTNLREAAVSIQSILRRKSAVLQLRNLRKANLEKERLQEVARLRCQVYEKQKQLEKVTATLSSEREEAKQTISANTTRIKSQEAEIDRLQKLLLAEMESTTREKKAHSELADKNAELLNQVGDANEKIRKFEATVYRLEQRVFQLDSENKFLKQNASVSSDVVSPTVAKVQANGHVRNGFTNTTVDAKRRVVKNIEPDKLEEIKELMIKSVSMDLGFTNGKPVAAFAFYRCFLHLKSFEDEATDIFDRVIDAVSAAIKGKDSNEHLAYWLTNTSLLLLLVERTISSEANGETLKKRRSPRSFFKRVSAATEGSKLAILENRLIGGLSEMRQFEAKYPAVAFKQKLTTLLEKIFGAVQQNLKKEISPFLILCIQAPRKNGYHMNGGVHSISDGSSAEIFTQQWRGIANLLTNYLNIFQGNYVNSFLICKVFTNTFSFVNVQLFNSLLLRREFCSASSGKYLKAGLSELEQWCKHATNKYAGTSWERLLHIRQAVEFLVLQGKQEKTLKDITNFICPALTTPQIYQLVTLYHDDDQHDAESVSASVVSSLRTMTGESRDSFLLADDFSVPFLKGDIARLMAQIEEEDLDLPAQQQQ